jgi:transketolase
MVHALARRDERVVFIGSDLSPNLLGEMKKEYPSRYYMEGITEANVIGMAAGMAMEGFIPYVNTIATFITRRCYEQVAVDLCLHDLPVRLIGNGGGYVYAPLGPTHQAIEDIAIMRALPHMTVTAVCDAEEMTRLMNATLDWPHPIYIRLGKGGDPVISKPERGFAIGKAIDMIDGEQGSSDVLLITTGVATTQALKAAGTLAAEGIRCRLLHVHTVKPLDSAAILEAAASARLVVTAEEHSLVGGLGSAVLEALSDGVAGRLPPVKRLGIPDRFSAHYGSQQALMEDCAIDADGIASAVRTALARL